MSADFANFLHWWQAEMETPTPYGWFHWILILITLGITVVMCVFFRNVKEKTYRKIMLAVSIVMILLEVYKQIFYCSFKYDSADPAQSYWSYDWYTFPFQFCATPMFVFPLIALLPSEGKAFKFIYQGLLGFACTYVLFGGLASIVYPNQLFVSMIGVNIQAMLYHGLMVAFGIYTFVWSRKEIGFKWILESAAVFGAFLVVAMALNCTVGLYCKSIDHTFNMFFISPFFECTLPVLRIFYPIVPYPVFLLLYIIPFFTISVILYNIQFGIYRLVKLIQKRAESVSEKRLGANY